eukprot:g25270.t1
MENSEMTPQQYLDKQGLPPEPQLDMKRYMFLASEFERLVEGEENPPVDMTRYALNPPEGKDAENAEAWYKAIQQAMTQLEHQTTTHLNVELLRRFGPNAWKTHNEYVDKMHERLVNAMAAQKKEMDTLNRARRAAQLQAAPKLQNLEREYYEKVAKNHEIELECFKLREDMERIQKRIAAKEGGGAKEKKQKVKK